MRKILFIFTLCILLFIGCTSSPDTSIDNKSPEQVETAVDNTDTTQQEADQTTVTEPTTSTISEDMQNAINDWILGTEYGIESIDFEDGFFSITMPQDRKEQLADYQLSDINEALNNLGGAFGFENCQVLFSDGSNIANMQSEQNTNTQEDSDIQEDTEITNSPSKDKITNLIFIHHSVGENWLNDGLAHMLNENNIHVADTYYGWSDIGDHTDTIDWPRWFNDDVMPSVYNKLDTETASNAIEAGNGENTIVMFKSCFPNSDVGDDFYDEVVVYDRLLYYFIQNTDKMFVLITPPPMQEISHPETTRELTNYLTDENGWLKDYPFDNVFVYDLYNVLTHPNNHHMLVDGVEKHVVANSNNTLYYDSSGDDHPNTEGNIKAAEEFVPLLLHWHSIFSN